MKFLITTIVLLFIHHTLYSQTGTAANVYNTQMTEKVKPMSPNAAALDKVALLPSNLSTGAAQLSIPIFEVKGKKISVPISLSYTAKGIYVEEDASNVGLGWILNAGGSVSQEIRGLRDMGILNNQVIPIRAPIYDANTNIDDYMNNIYVLPNGFNQPLDSYNPAYTKDPQPDIFTYNFAGQSGKFAFANSGKVLMSPRKNFLIDGFGTIITDDNGNRYSFNQQEISWTSASANSSQLSIANYLTQIVSADGSEIVTFSYESESHTHYSNPHYSGLVNAQDGLVIQAEPLVTSGTNVERLSQISTNFGVTVKFIPDDQPRSDLFAGSVKGLKRIEIYQNDVLIKSFALEKEYVRTIDPINPSNFSGLISNTDYLNYRLYLKSIKEYDNQTNLSKPPYTFDYYGRTAQNLDSLPNKFSYGQDHWGFFNGISGNNGLCPGYSGEFVDYLNSYYTPAVQINYSNANREPSFIYSRCGTLKQITYPTGAFNRFVYESHTYNQIEFNLGNTPTSGTAGGIRLKEQIIFDPQTSQTIAKEYIYENGKVCNPVYSNYVVKNREGFLSYLGSITDSQNTIPGKTYIKVDANSFYNLFSYSGSHISYAKVTEKQLGNGTIENVFAIPYLLTSSLPLLEIKKSAISGPVPDAAPGVPVPSLLATDIAPPIPLDWTYGKQISQIYKDESGNKISEEGNFFKQDFYGLDTLYNVSVNIVNYQTTVTNNPALSIYYNYFKYLTLLGTNLPVQKNTYQYAGSNRIEQAQYTTYNSHLQPYIVKTINSDGTNTYKKYKYTYDYDFSCATNLTDEANAIKTLVDKNMVAMPVEEQVMLETNGVKKLISGKLYTFTISGTNVLPKQAYSIENNGTLADTTMSYIDCWGNLIKHSAYKSNIVYSQYDAAGNITEFSKQDGAKTAVMWTQNNPSPIAQATNAAINEIYHDNFEEGTDYPAAVTQDFTMHHTGLASGHIYDPGSGENYYHSNTWLQVALTATKKFHYSGWFYSDGPTYQLFLFMKRAGETGYFSYVSNVDGSQTGGWVYLEGDYDVPADVTQLNLRVDNNGGGNVWFDDLRLYPSAGQMTTYTYSPLVGMTSQTDPKGQTTYYEYDSFQRLMNVKDKDGNIIKHTDYHYQNQ